MVIDDEPVARSRVISLLREEADIEVVGECADGAEAVSRIEGASPDLLFLDVQMPELDGFQVLRALPPETVPAVVFVTAYDEYALRAFEVHALDYLLKPFSAERFRSALSHARTSLAQRRATTLGRHLLDLLPDMRRPADRERLLVKANGRIHFVRTDEIEWCEAAGNYVRLYLIGSESHLMRETMAHLESNLDPHQFIRIHRGSIVNVDRIQELQSSLNGEYTVVLRSGTRVTLSRGYRDALQARLGKTF
jgi:two-component system, LytTR family, response regulator